MIKPHVPAITGRLKIRIWDALRIEAQKRGLPVAGFVRQVFQQALRHSDRFAPSCQSSLPPRPHRSTPLHRLLHDQLNKY